MSLLFIMSGGSGDADLYVKFGGLPANDSYDCRPFMIGNCDTCAFSNPTRDTSYVMIHGHAAYSGVTRAGVYQVLK